MVTPEESMGHTAEHMLAGDDDRAYLGVTVKSSQRSE